MSCPVVELLACWKGRGSNYHGGALWKWSRFAWCRITVPKIIQGPSRISRISFFYALYHWMMANLCLSSFSFQDFLGLLSLWLTPVVYTPMLPHTSFCRSLIKYILPIKTCKQASQNASMIQQRTIFHWIQLQVTKTFKLYFFISTILK